MLVYLRDRSAQIIFTCRHTERKVADQTLHLTQSQYTDTGPASPSTDSIGPGACQGSQWSVSVLVTCMTRPWKNSLGDDPIGPGACQGSQWSVSVLVTCMTRPWKNSLGDDPIGPGACQGSQWSVSVLVTCMTRPWKNSLGESWNRSPGLSLSWLTPRLLGERSV